MTSMSKDNQAGILACQDNRPLPDPKICADVVRQTGGHGI